MNRETETGPLLQVNGVSQSFSIGGGLMKPAGRVQALDNVSLTLNAGETLGLVGSPAAVKARWPILCWG